MWSHWVNFLHFYQPPTQTREILRKVARECYLPVVRILLRNPHIRITLNINACLTEMLAKESDEFSEVLEGLRSLGEQGQVEFTGSAKFHCILPLLPKKEMERQIRLNEETNRALLGDWYRPTGFFPPEMCYSAEVAEVISGLGYQWIILDEIAASGKLGGVSWEAPYAWRSNRALAFVFRHRQCSNILSFAGIKGLKRLFPTFGGPALGGPACGRISEISDIPAGGEVPPLAAPPAAAPPLAGSSRSSTPPGAGGTEPVKGNGCDHEQDLRRGGVLLTATDGEIYGHHHPGMEAVWEEICSEGAVTFLTVREYLKLLPQEKSQLLDPVPASWATDEEEIRKGVAYPCWLYPGNPIHQKQWELARLCLGVASAMEETKDRPEALSELRKRLDPGLHSCQFWWACAAPWWSPDMIQKGATLLLSSLDPLDSEMAESFNHEARVARGLYEEIIFLASRWEKEGEAERRKKEYLRAHPQVSTLTFDTQPVKP